MATVKVGHYGASAIGGAVFTNYDFIFKVHLLSQDAFDRLRDKALMVAGDHGDAQLHR
jgi:hypothetical protein